MVWGGGRGVFVWHDQEIEVARGWFRSNGSRQLTLCIEGFFIKRGCVRVFTVFRIQNGWIFYPSFYHQCVVCVLDIVQHTACPSSLLWARAEVSGWWCHWQTGNTFPGVLGGYVSMEIPGSLVWMCHRHDSSGTSQFSWYTKRTGMSVSHYRHYALRHWAGLQLKASRHVLLKKSIFGTFANWTTDRIESRKSVYVFRSLTFITTKQMQSGGVIALCLLICSSVCKCLYGTLVHFNPVCTSSSQARLPSPRLHPYNTITFRFFCGHYIHKVRG